MEFSHALYIWKPRYTYIDVLFIDNKRSNFEDLKWYERKSTKSSNTIIVNFYRIRLIDFQTRKMVPTSKSSCTLLFHDLTKAQQFKIQFLLIYIEEGIVKFHLTFCTPHPIQIWLQGYIPLYSSAHRPVLVKCSLPLLQKVEQMLPCKFVADKRITGALIVLVLLIAIAKSLLFLQVFFSSFFGNIGWRFIGCKSPNYLQITLKKKK